MKPFHPLDDDTVFHTFSFRTLSYSTICLVVWMMKFLLPVDVSSLVFLLTCTVTLIKVQSFDVFNVSFFLCVYLVCHRSHLVFVSRVSQTVPSLCVFLTDQTFLAVARELTIPFSAVEAFLCILYDCHLLYYCDLVSHSIFTFDVNPKGGDPCPLWCH